MSFERSSGILLHPTSLPSLGGIGDLGPAAYAFVDFLHSAKQTLWQVLPLSPVGLGNSPYSAISAFAGNPFLISLELLAKHGWIDATDLRKLPVSNGPIDYAALDSTKLPLLKKAAEQFLRKMPDALGEHERYSAFCRDHAWWLEDYVLFSCLRSKYGIKSWNQWPRDIAERRPEGLQRARQELPSELAVERVLQFAFFEQWKALRAYCAQRGIKIIGDVAIFVNYDSADVWTNPEFFRLDARLEPEVVAGVPPDAFSASGQRWGNPIYRWDALKSRGYDWWIKRMGWALTTCDYVRLDHFRGFQQYWEIPAAEATAIHGTWVDGPKEDLFHALRTALGDLPFIAEDLGLITPDVNQLRAKLEIPGMKVLQFGFSDRGAHIYLPHRYEEKCVVYTGTHDNDTAMGWWQSLNSEVQKTVIAYLGEHKDGINWALIRAAAGSPASFAIFPLQDVLGLDARSRMNTPSRVEGNWRFRFSDNELTPELAAKLAHIAEVTDRDHHRS